MLYDVLLIRAIIVACFDFIPAAPARNGRARIDGGPNAGKAMLLELHQDENLGEGAAFKT